MDPERAMRHVDEHGELLPILWSQSSPIIATLQMLAHRTFVPGKLHVAMARVAMTPAGRIGMNHVTPALLDGQSFDEVLEEAFAALAQGLRVEGLADPDRTGEVAVLQRQGPFASSAVALPNFHEQMSSLLGGDRMLVGLPDPDTALVTLMESGWADELQSLVMSSPADATEFVPCVLALEPGGLRFIAERSR